MLETQTDTGSYWGVGCDYELDGNWPKLPSNIVLNDVSGVAVDSSGNCYLFNRGKDPVVVVDRDGYLKATWGHDLFKRPHGAFMGPDDTIWLTDDHDHTVRRCTLDGDVLLLLGQPGRPQPFMSGLPFNRPTHTALSPDGEIYVSDGYGNSSVHKYSRDGKHLFSWGTPGIRPGEFNLPHNITCDDAGRVYVADRESFRVQIFDGDGHFETEWHGMYRPMGLFTERGKSPRTFIGENGTAVAVDKSVPNLGARLSIYDHTGNRVGWIGGRQPGTGPNQFLAPHCVAIDDRGDVYVGEVSWNTWPKKFPNTPMPADLRSVRKFIKKAA